jgi:hypothetical protein
VLRVISIALARCENCGRPNGKKGKVYSEKSYLPLGYPLSGVICGSTGCMNSSAVWLLDWEEAEYQKGQRVFKLTGRVQHAKFSCSMRETGPGYEV